VERSGRGNHASDALLERTRVCRQVVVAGLPCTRDRRRDAPPQQLECGAAFQGDLASEQIESLDAVGTFVDRVQAVVAIELLDGIVARVAVAAQNLDREVVRRQAPLRGPRFGDRRQDLEQELRVRARLRRVGRVLVVHQACAVQIEGEPGLDVGLLGEEHPPHVGVLDDPDLR
jgi:hypothetical protein